VPFTLAVLENMVQENTQTENALIKCISEKAHNAEYSKTKLPRFSHLLWPTARKQSGLTLQRSWEPTRVCTTSIISVNMINTALYRVEEKMEKRKHMVIFMMQADATYECRWRGYVPHFQPRSMNHGEHVRYRCSPVNAKPTWTSCG